MKCTNAVGNKSQMTKGLSRRPNVYATLPDIHFVFIIKLAPPFGQCEFINASVHRVGTNWVKSRQPINVTSLHPPVTG